MLLVMAACGGSAALCLAAPEVVQSIVSPPVPMAAAAGVLAVFSAISLDFGHPSVWQEQQV